ncbi:MAG: acyltransferase [Armatimonadetes bacterium]|nr:acyltransferase [Armatimonadota bacterium]
MSPRFLPHDWFSEPLPANVEIGPRSWLYSTYAFRHYCSRRPLGVRIGHDTGVYSGTFFDLGPEGELEIGDYCTLVGGILSTAGRIAIGHHVLISHEVVIADCFAAVPPDASRARIPPADRTVIVGDNVWIGARAVVLGPAQIGEGAIIGAAAVVVDDVSPFTVVAGNPARIVGSVGP